MATGHDVLILGRNAAAAHRLLPNAGWIEADLSDPQPEIIWQDRLEDVDAVVNASGALQSGARDNLEAVHHQAIATLIRACETCGVNTFVQISSVGAKLDASTEFMRSKARGDACVSSSTLSWFIVRPGLVIGPNAYGGTALIRMLASVPLIQPMALGDTLIQTVSVSDLSDVVLDAIEGRLPSHEAFDVVEESQHSLREVVGEFRSWLGFERARVEVTIPGFVLSAVAIGADALGYAGWRSPLRTTTLQVLAEGVLGDSRSFSKIDSRNFSSLQQTLDNLPSTLQERWFARLYFLMPVTIAVLAAFWVLTGVIALLNFDESIRMSGLSEVASRIALVSGSVVDVTLGGAILYRPWSKMACWSMAAVTSVYLVVGSVFRPDLWSDPLGPLLKAVPILVLVLVAALFVEDR